MDITQKEEQEGQFQKKNNYFVKIQVSGRTSDCVSGQASLGGSVEPDQRVTEKWPEAFGRNL